MLPRMVTERSPNAFLAYLPTLPLAFAFCAKFSICFLNFAKSSTSTKALLGIALQGHY